MCRGGGMILLSDGWDDDEFTDYDDPFDENEEEE